MAENITNEEKGKVSVPSTKDDLLKMISDINEKVAKIDNISERMEAMEKQAKDAQTFWDRHPELEPRKGQYSVTSSMNEVEGLFKYKGMDGFVEAISTPTKVEVMKNLQDLSDDLWLTAQIIAFANNLKGKSVKLQDLDAYKNFHDYIDKTGIRGMVNRSTVKDALSATGAGLGTEWVPTMWSSQMQEIYRLSRNVPPLFESFPMPSDTYKWPIQTGKVTIYNAGEATSTNAAAITSSTIGTDAPTFTARKPAGRVVWSGELDEASIIPMLPTLRIELPKAVAEAVEHAIINGDRTATHMDSDINLEAGDSVGKMWDGLRRHISNRSSTYDTTSTTGGTAAYEYTDFGQVQLKMGKYAGLTNPTTEFAWLLSMSAYIQAAYFDELRKWLNAGGDLFTLPRGTVNIINGSPVVLSEKVRQDLNASGVYDNVTKTKTEFIGVFRPGFKRGIRRAQTIEVVRISRSDQYEIVVIAREDFEAMQTVFATGEALAAAGINIAA